MKEVRALLLAAGFGTRLGPLTKDCPKCLMPIGQRPLLEHWLCTLFKHGISKALINIHHHRNLVESFLTRRQFKNWAFGIYEPELLGTARTLRENQEFFSTTTTLLVHADNWCHCDFDKFLEFHRVHRPGQTLITMMTFRTPLPKECGIVNLDSNGVVREFFEKIENPPGNLANGAVYLLEPEVISWMKKQPSINDFSKDVLPHFLGRIATWENTKIHRDIGTIQSLLNAQKDAEPEICWPEIDDWLSAFLHNPIHEQLGTVTR